MASAPFLTSAHFPSVRRLIDPSWTDADLPDAVIADDIFLGAAAAQVLALDRHAATRSGAAEERVLRAAVYFTAAALLRALPALTSEKFTDYTATYDPEARNRLAEQLEGRGAAEVRVVLNARPAIHSLQTASGRRGR